MTDSEDPTIDEIPNKFTNLPVDFCSLGQTRDYYFKLKDLTGKNFESILHSLRDSAYFPDIQEKFQKKETFKRSLIRYNDVERISRVIKYELFDYDLSNLYSFKYSFLPPFAGTPVDVNFEFNGDSEVPNRIYALIGKNGTGKTQLITSLPLRISEKDDNFFIPRTPLFSKVIAVSYSVFDKFKIPKRTSNFNYVYCGLRKDNDEQFSEKGLVLRFYSTGKRIETIQRINQWRKILLNFIDEDLVEKLIVPREDSDIKNGLYSFNLEGFNEIRDRLSSGQSSILFIISEIVANIRFDSLLLYDEPETHLHPNAITQLMNTIYQLVNEFQSYCIIATHSPLIIRELLSRNVFVLERFDNTSSVRRISIESFGENLTTLTEEVFGNREVPKQYKKIIEEFIGEGKTYEEILSLLEFDDLPLSLNARIYIRSLMAN
jgi:energy-coupling factor transporter ATP-binding protein EcfA2